MTYESDLQSVNVGRPRPLEWKGTRVQTGIFKDPVSGPVAVRRLGLEGDGQADLTVHGGADKAVYAYSFANTKFWIDSLEIPDLGPGSFGENLTLEDLPDATVALGDVLQIGPVRLQVTQPRQPCSKLAMKFGLPQLPKRFTRSGRIGFYLRVLEEGSIEAGMKCRCVERETDPLSIEALNRALLIDREAVSELRRALESPALSEAWREQIEARLERSRG